RPAEQKRDGDAAGGAAGSDMVAAGEAVLEGGRPAAGAMVCVGYGGGVVHGVGGAPVCRRGRSGIHAECGRTVPGCGAGGMVLSRQASVACEPDVYLSALGRERRRVVAVFVSGR